MLQILLVPTNEYVATLISSQRDAQAEAIRQVMAWMKTTPHGRRLLAYCGKGPIPWSIARQYVVISEMVGVWIDTHKGRVLPEDIDDDEPLLFKNLRGDTMLGTFNAAESVFINSASESSLASDRVSAFLIIPEK